MDVAPNTHSDSDPGLAGKVIAVHLSPKHEFSKNTAEVIDVVAGHGVAGDAHFGPTAQHLSRKRRDPLLPNLRQVHLIQSELFEELAADGFEVSPGDLGENVTTSGLNLLALSAGTTLHIGDVVLTLTGLRTPCAQINQFAPGLMKRLTPRDHDGTHYLAGVMTTVAVGGSVSAGDAIRVQLPTEPHQGLELV